MNGRPQYKGMPKKPFLGMLVVPLPWVILLNYLPFWNTSVFFSCITAVCKKKACHLKFWNMQDERGLTLHIIWSSKKWSSERSYLLGVKRGIPRKIETKKSSHSIKLTGWDNTLKDCGRPSCLYMSNTLFCWAHLIYQ